MIPFVPSVRALAYAAPVDMRKGFEGLWALVTRELGRDVLGGELFVFVGRDRRRAKVLYFDGTGLCLLHKRLETGRFACLWQHPGAAGACPVLGGLLAGGYAASVSTSAGSFRAAHLALLPFLKQSYMSLCGFPLRTP